MDQGQQTAGAALGEVRRHRAGGRDGDAHCLALGEWGAWGRALPPPRDPSSPSPWCPCRALTAPGTGTAACSSRSTASCPVSPGAAGAAGATARHGARSTSFSFPTEPDWDAQHCPTGRRCLGMAPQGWGPPGPPPGAPAQCGVSVSPPLRAAEESAAKIRASQCAQRDGLVSVVARGGIAMGAQGRCPQHGACMARGGSAPPGSPQGPVG